MIDRLKIENFKCFSELSMEFRPFTLLCGVNSSGKSSVIQALLLGMEIAADKKAEGNLDLMDAKYNIDCKGKYLDVLDKYENLKLIKKTPQGYKLTPNGVLVSNVILADFLD